jgi:hypothetical protein
MALRETTALQFAEAIRAARYWVEKIVPEQFPGYTNCNHNRDVLFGWIYDEGGMVTLENLTLAATNCANRLHGLSDGQYVARKAAKVKASANKKEADRLQAVHQANQSVIIEWLARECPLGLIVNGDLYGTTQDKMVAFIRRNYPGQETITPAMLNTAVQTLGEALDWFDRSPESMQLRNQPPPPPRKLSQRMRIEAGLEKEPPPAHESTRPAISMEETAKTALAATQKRMGIDPDQEYRNRAEAISVGNKQGKFDHGRTADLRKVFVYKDAAKTVIAWKETWEMRDKIATQIEKEKNK